MTNDESRMDAQLYQAAIAQQFPQLDLSGFRLLGEGGVFRAFETDNGLVWRFLKQAAGEASLDLEIRLLPELAGALSLPIPRYEYVSDRALSPRFVGYRKIEGVPLTRERLAACRSDRPVRQLARFLTDLHRFPLERARTIGVPPSAPDERRAQWTQWDGQIRQHVYPLLNERQRTWAEHTLSDLLNDDAMSDYTPALCHSDLWAEHILFDPEQERLTGVIDLECVPRRSGWRLDSRVARPRRRGRADAAGVLWRPDQLDLASSDRAVGKLRPAQRNPVRRALR
jgi:aminoglycoside 2''-phosphotransferase